MLCLDIGDGAHVPAFEKPTRVAVIVTRSRHIFVPCARCLGTRQTCDHQHKEKESLRWSTKNTTPSTGEHYCLFIHNDKPCGGVFCFCEHDSSDPILRLPQLRVVAECSSVQLLRRKADVSLHRSRYRTRLHGHGMKWGLRYSPQPRSKATSVFPPSCDSITTPVPTR